MNPFFVAAPKGLVLSGASSKLISEFDLTARTSHLEGYIVRDDLKGFIQRNFAVTGGRASVIARIIDGALFDLAELSEMPIAVAAVDLATSTNERERRAGLKMLEKLLEAWRG